MSTENQQDTINVELPIEATGGELVVAAGMYLNRSDWRDAASGRRIVEWTDIIRAVAPAVVAWIERDEWEPLDLPEDGRRIKATLRDGRVETFKVREIVDVYDWAWVWKADSIGEARFIQRVRDVDDSGPADIVAWEYVDEPTVDLASIADKIDAAVNELREAIIATTGEGDSNG